MQQRLIDDRAPADVHIGDLAWRARPHTHFELSLEITLYAHGDRLLGWTWVRADGGFDLYLTRDHGDRDTSWAQMLDGVDRTVAARRAAGDVIERVHAWFIEDAEAIEPLLTARRFTASEGNWGLVARDLSAIPELALPDGYRFGWVDSDDDVLGRVEVHRAAFAPSEMSLACYRRVRRTWPYRPELDRVVRDAGGQTVAACTGWIDEANHAGYIEPMGTLPAHQNRGLARALVADTLRALRAAGAGSGMIGSSGEAAVRAYEAAGFERSKREIDFTRAL
jgi:ribosomal protein S18 acetylase RimI-like enzyme